MKELGEREKKGRLMAMLSLEAALVFPAVLILILSLIGAIQAEQDAIILSHALDQTAREVALLLPLADLAEQYLDPVSLIKELIPDQTLAAFALDGLSDLAATALASPFLLERVDSWARATAHSQGRRPPQGARRLAIDFDRERQSIWLQLTYDQSRWPIEHQAFIRSRIPIWNAGLFKDTGEGEEEKEKGEIWLLPNFERGQRIRSLFGGHLPLSYPVIAAWNGSEAVAIKSMDLTAPSWSSPSASGRRIDQFVRDLSSFEGAGGEGPSPGEIRSKRLILVIPDNDIEWKTAGLVAGWKAAAAVYGVNLDIREFGTSHAHEPVE